MQYRKKAVPKKTTGKAPASTLMSWVQSSKKQTEEVADSKPSSSAPTAQQAQESEDDRAQKNHF